MTSFPHPHACPVCGATDARAIYDLRQVTNLLAVPGVVMRCRDCGLESKALVTANAWAA